MRVHVNLNLKNLKVRERLIICMLMGDSLVPLSYIFASPSIIALPAKVSAEEKGRGITNSGLSTGTNGGVRGKWRK